MRNYVFCTPPSMQMRGEETFLGCKLQKKLGVGLGGQIKVSVVLSYQGFSKFHVYCLRTQNCENIHLREIQMTYITKVFHRQNPAQK